MSLPRVVGFAGKAGAGKDTAAKALYPLGYDKIAMAAALKSMIRNLLDFQGVDPYTVERMMEGDLKEVECEFLGGKSPRVAMQTLGTEWGRECISPTLWVDAVRRKIEKAPKDARFLITDVRFVNEAIMIRELGGTLIWIDRETSTKEVSHKSETESSQFRCDAYLPNDGDIETLHSRVRDAVGMPDVVLSNEAFYNEANTGLDCPCGKGHS